jgi:hypothetical protein
MPPRQEMVSGRVHRGFAVVQRDPTRRPTRGDSGHDQTAAQKCPYGLGEARPGPARTGCLPLRLMAEDSG